MKKTTLIVFNFMRKNWKGTILLSWVALSLFYFHGISNDMQRISNDLEDINSFFYSGDRVLLNKNLPTLSRLPGRLNSKNFFTLIDDIKSIINDIKSLDDRIDLLEYALLKTQNNQSDIESTLSDIESKVSYMYIYGVKIE